MAFGRESRELAEAVGRLLIVGFEGGDFSEVENLITDIRPAGLIFFKRNVTAPGGAGALRDLIARAQALAESFLGRRLLVAIDHEGGSVQRLARPYTVLPSAQDVAGRTLDEARELYAQAGWELAATGFNVNFAPVLDLAPPDSPVSGTRSYGEEPARVAEYGWALVAAYRAAGVMTCGKHFPGLGSALLDPHHELPAIPLDMARLRAADMAPFRVLAAQGLPAIMTTHALYPALDAERPATFSRRIADIVKEEMGFAGPLVTDDLEMGAVVKNYPLGEAVVEAVLAGHDLALICRRAEYVKESAAALAAAIASGRITEARLADAHARSRRFYEAAEAIRPQPQFLHEYFEKFLS